jgi:hypothetical protein
VPRYSNCLGHIECFAKMMREKCAHRTPSGVRERQSLHWPHIQYILWTFNSWNIAHFLPVLISSRRRLGTYKSADRLEIVVINVKTFEYTVDSYLRRYSTTKIAIFFYFTTMGYSRSPTAFTSSQKNLLSVPN